MKSIKTRKDPNFGKFSISREMQLFLLGYVVIEICEIFTVGGFPLPSDVRKVGQAIERKRNNNNNKMNIMNII